MEFLSTLSPVAMAAIGTGFTFLMTTLGAAVVFFIRGEVNPSLQRSFLGFAAGVMIAASVWSLLIPAIETAEEQGTIGWLPAAGGFLIGVLFLYLLDKIIPHLHPGSSESEGPKTKLPSSTLLVLAVTLHNIPEGMAVGLACAMAVTGGGSAAAALALALGIGLQNFPEGAAVSLPLKQDGFSNSKAFVYGSLSGLVEPIGGVIAVLIAGGIAPLMPWFLSFAAGAMMYVVVEELIPEANAGKHSNAGTLGAMIGFVIMMIMDVALG
ncbi:MAG: ZIP family metal transporter [Oscillospiraceae bacterium]